MRELSASSEYATAAPGNPMFVILYRQGPSWIAGKPITDQLLSPHLEYLQQLFAAGYVALAGPFLDAASGGIAVIRASDEATAARICANDPAVIDGVLVGEVRSWKSVLDSGSVSRQRFEERVRSDDNVHTVRQIFSAVETRGSAGDATARWQAYERAYHPDVVIHEADSLPYGGDYTGPGAVGRHADAFVDAWASLQDGEGHALQPTFLAGDNLVAALWRHRARNPRTDERFDMPAVSIYVMQDGHVADARMFHFDTSAVRTFLERAKGITVEV